MTKHIKFGLKVKLGIIYEVLEYVDYLYEYTTMYKVYYKAFQYLKNALNLHISSKVLDFILVCC